MGNPSPRYTAEFKQKAVEPYGKSGTTYAEVTRGPGCPIGSRRPTPPGRCPTPTRSRWPRTCAG